jgi:prepilin-type N-terminal cleavage/methylation domain-containing protein
MTSPLLPNRRNGFTLVEVLTVVVVIGILSGMAVPIYRDVSVRADAARVISDVNTIQLAVAEYLVDNKAHPSSGEIGVMPPQLEDRLPAEFPFAWGAVKYRYRRWAIPGTGTWYGRQARGLPNVAVEIHSDSPVMMRHLEALAMGRGTMVTRESITIVLE